MLIYKVLLVDDEEEVMDMIERRISWPELGFEAGRSSKTPIVFFQR